MNPISIVIAGFLIGALTSYSGVGAGALLTPLLVLAGGVATNVAIGSDLLFALATKIAALIAHVRANTVDRKLLMRLSPAGVIGALVGVGLTSFLHVKLAHTQFDHTLRIMLAVALLISALAIALRKMPADGVQHAPTYPLKRLAFIGFFVGLVVSLTSVGAGSLTLPLLLLMVPGVLASRLVGTDIAFSVALLVPALLGHLSIGDVNLQLSGLLILGSIPGVFVGARIHRTLPERAFRIGMSLILGIVGIVMIA